MPYGYLLNKVLNYFRVIGSKGIPRATKQKINLTTLLENSCTKEKVGTVS